MDYCKLQLSMLDFLEYINDEGGRKIVLKKQAAGTNFSEPEWEVRSEIPVILSHPDSSGSHHVHIGEEWKSAVIAVLSAPNDHAKLTLSRIEICKNEGFSVHRALPSSLTSSLERTLDGKKSSRTKG